VTGGAFLARDRSDFRAPEAETLAHRAVEPATCKMASLLTIENLLAIQRWAANLPTLAERMGAAAA